MTVIVQSDDKVIKLDLITGRQVEVAKPDPAATLLSFPDRSNRALFRIDSRRGSALAVAGASAKPKIVIAINQPLESIAEFQQATVRYTVSAGTTLSSCMILPTGWVKGRRYPLIVNVYPDDSGDCWPSRLANLDPTNMLNFQLLAAHGYIVLFPSSPSSLIRSPDGPTRGMTRVVLAAVDAAIRDGFADEDRLGIFGFSQGFHDTLQVLTETRRFRAAYAGSGLSDFASAYGSVALIERLDGESDVVPQVGRFEGPSSSNGIGLPPWKAPQLYVLNSPTFFADKIETPILLTNSDFDSFASSQTDEIFSALYRLRKRATYVTYWGEGHGNLSPANIRDFWTRIYQWFDPYLLPETTAGTPEHSQRRLQ